MPSQEQWWNTLFDLIASRPRCLYPKIRSIQWCRLFDTNSLSKASLLVSRKWLGSLAHLGSLTSPTLFRFCLTPRSSLREFFRKFQSSWQNSGINYLTLVGFLVTFFQSPFMLLNRRSGLSNFPLCSFSMYQGCLRTRYPITQPGALQCDPQRNLGSSIFQQRSINLSSLYSSRAPNGLVRSRKTDGSSRSIYQETQSEITQGKTGYCERSQKDLLPAWLRCIRYQQFEISLFCHKQVMCQRDSQRKQLSGAIFMRALKMRSRLSQFSKAKQQLFSSRMSQRPMLESQKRLLKSLDIFLMGIFLTGWLERGYRGSKQTLAQVRKTNPMIWFRGSTLLAKT